MSKQKQNEGPVLHSELVTLRKRRKRKSKRYIRNLFILIEGFGGPRRIELPTFALRKPRPLYELILINSLRRQAPCNID